MARNPKALKPGAYTVLFDPLPFANLVNQVMSALPITAVESGLSFLQGKIGQKVASNQFTLWDDGTTPGGFSSSSTDEEGVPSQKNLVIEEGVLKTYLHNTSTAKKYSTTTTANAGIISPHPNNGVVRPGDMSVDEMIAGMKRGLYVTNTWYTRFQNYVTGEFSTIPRDGIFYIENGKIKHPVTGIRISDNILRMLMSISAVGKDVKQVRGWEVEMPVFTPAAVIDDVVITKSTSQKHAED
jgi:PmbA protein